MEEVAVTGFLGTTHVPLENRHSTVEPQRIGLAVAGPGNIAIERYRHVDDYVGHCSPSIFLGARLQASKCAYLSGGLRRPRDDGTHPLFRRGPRKKRILLKRPSASAGCKKPQCASPTPAE